jgi:hypothetical protein
MRKCLPVCRYIKVRGVTPEKPFSGVIDAGRHFRIGLE